MREHELKILPSFLAPVVSGEKTFEITKNDRNFEVGDLLWLREWDGETYTGDEAYATVTYITDYMQRSGYVVMGINLIEPFGA